MNRREFLRIAAISAAGTVLPVRYVPAQGSLGEEERADLKPSRFITPAEDFYVQHIRNAPELAAEHWKLAITGRVANMRLFTYEEILKMPGVKTVHTLSCIGDPIGGAQIGNAEWKGISTRALLEEVGVQPEVKKATFRCADGYHTGIPIEHLLHPDALLVYEMNGKPLPVEHGYPLRLLNPGHYGQKCPKWILNIDLTEKDYQGYWESRGWSDEADVKMATRIGQPADNERLEGPEYIISGSAYDGGNHGGIARVEVSFDGGETWEEAEIWASGPPLAWVLWSYSWVIPQGERREWSIQARAIANDGTVQTPVSADAYPAGAEGYHEIHVRT